MIPIGIFLPPELGRRIRAAERKVHVGRSSGNTSAVLAELDQCPEVMSVLYPQKGASPSGRGLTTLQGRRRRGRRRRGHRHARRAPWASTFAGDGATRRHRRRWPEWAPAGRRTHRDGLTPGEHSARPDRQYRIRRDFPFIEASPAAISDKCFKRWGHRRPHGVTGTERRTFIRSVLFASPSVQVNTHRLSALHRLAQVDPLGKNRIRRPARR